MSKQAKKQNTTDPSSVNSEIYWDDRFKEDWDEKQGDKQSVFFMNLALEIFPDWLKEVIKAENLSICDWGCAEGDGTNVLSRAFPDSAVTGIDFAETAIKNATKRYKRKNLDFSAVDLLTQTHKEKYDIVFSSNVLEHFHQPWEVFGKISGFAKDLFIMMVPFNEDKDNLHYEHFHSFSSGQFSLSSEDWGIVHFEVRNTAVLPVTYWVGQQAVVVFASKNFIAKHNLTFADVNLSVDRILPLQDSLDELKEDNTYLTSELSDLSQRAIDYEERIEDQMRQIGNLTALTSSRGASIARKITGTASRLIPDGSPQDKLARIPFKVHRRFKRRKQYLNLIENIDLIKNSGLFDEDFYRAQNRDVAEHGVSPIEHYLKYGSKEGRQPGPLFDQAYYLARYSDVRSGKLNPLVHYLTFGRSESREPRLNFDTALTDKRISIAFQLDAFDRGGLEEVVLMLASGPEVGDKYNVYIFVSGYAGGYLSELAEKRGIRVISLNQDKIYLDYLIKKLNIKLCNLHYSIFGVNTYKKNNVKLIYTIHNNYIWSDSNFESVRRNEYRKIDRFISVSGQVGEYFSNKFNIQKQKLHVVTNGINIDESSNIVPLDRRDYKLRDDDFVFVNVASFTANKYHAAMIVALSKVVKKYPNAKLLLVGNVIDKAYFNTIRSLIAKYGVENNVQIIDYIPKQKLLGLLEISDCFVMPSLTEGFSIATIEAMYHKLPLILTDVGGARHSIENNDIGIIVKNTYDNVLELTNEKIKQLYVDDSNLHNLDELVAAMENMVQHKASWKEKAQLGRKKVEKYFQAKHVVEGYLREFFTTLHSQSALKMDRTELVPSGAKVAFFAPYPTKERVTEGWMSRINAVDKIIGNDAKVYINVSPGDEPLVIHKHETDGWELTIGKKSVDYSEVIDRVVAQVSAVYVHTLHLAEYALPWLPSKKVIVDFHGITPEEEVMMGRAYLKEKYELIEKDVLEHARACVMVTNAMVDHYKEKYGIKPKKTIILPIVEDIKSATKRSLQKSSDDKFKVVYSGGTQAWQNVDAMLDLVKATRDYTAMTFLSHDWKSLEEKGEKLGVSQDTKYEFCEKSNLQKKYKEFDLGLVLRDDTPVNRVACPTKLYEYMKSGILPIVRSEKMGDFVKFGYGYIKEEDYINNKLPSSRKMEEMLHKNYEAADKMNDTFKNGSKTLSEIVS